MFSSESDPEEAVALYETAFHMFDRVPAGIQLNATILS